LVLNINYRFNKWFTFLTSENKIKDVLGDYFTFKDLINPLVVNKVRKRFLLQGWPRRGPQAIFGPQRLF
jgi:hypothetical protein